MIRNGIQFRRADRLVGFTPTPEQVLELQGAGLLPAEPYHSAYVVVGEWVPKWDTPTPSAIPANRKWTGSDQDLWVIPIRVTSWLHTNMPYVTINGKDRILCVEDGVVYSAPA